MPIEGAPSSNQQAAFGAAGGIASTGFDRVYHKDKKGEPVDPEDQIKFKNAMIDMITTDSTPVVDTKRDRKPLEEQLIYQEELKRISDYRLRSIVKPVDLEKRRVKREENENIETSEGENLNEPTEKYLSTAERLKLVEEDLLKNYIALNSKRIVGIPKDALEGIKVELEVLKNQLIASGLILSDFYYLDQQTIALIKESFLKLIKDRFYSSGETSFEIANWILESKKGKNVVDLITLFEKDSISIEERDDILNSFEIPDLIQIASHLKLDIESWMKMLHKESVKIQKTEGLDVFFKVLELPKIEEITKITDNLRNTQTELYLEDNPIRKLQKLLKIVQIKNDLQLKGLNKTQIDEIITQARKVAWLKTISALKETHLNRILTTSSIDFIKSSRKIEKLTNKAKKLGYDIPKEGIRWIETGLTKLGLETAEYKLELLKSLQKISYEPEREVDIKRLEKIIQQLKRKMPKEK